MNHREDARWSLTPVGRRRVGDLVGGVSPGRMESELSKLSGAPFAHAIHTTLPPWFAPVRWSAGIARLLKESPFDANVFCMTRFPKDKTDRSYLDPVRDVIATIEAALSGHGLRLLLASDRQIDDDVLGNVAAHMWASKYGIGLFENRAKRGLNYNVVIEVGSMLMTGRRCGLLRDTSAPEMPTDLVGQIYKTVEFDNLDNVATEAHAWARADLMLGACEMCGNIQF
jgi:hypothetical protein